MATIGEGQFTYEVQEGWGRLPAGYAFREVAAVGYDAEDNVYAFNRGEHPMIVFDKDGNFIKSWSEGVFPRASGSAVMGASIWPIGRTTGCRCMTATASFWTSG